MRRSLNKSDASIAAGAIDDAEMFVPTSDGAPRKKSFCLYCKTMQCVISRHLETVHRDEPEVKKFADLPRGMKIIIYLSIHLSNIVFLR